MSPIIDSLSGLSARGYGLFGVAASTTSFESIATVTVGAGGSSSISFSSIPSTYKHLQVRAIIKSTASAGPYYAWGRFNSDTGSNYATHALLGTGAAASTDNGTSLGYFYASIMPDSTAASVFTGFVLDVLDYANTNKYKTVRSLAGYDSNNTLGRIYLHSGLWQSTSAINSITILPQTGATNFAQYSSFALYGIS